MNSLPELSTIISIVISLIFGLFAVITFGIPKRFGDFLWLIAAIAVPWIALYQFNHGLV